MRVELPAVPGWALGGICRSETLPDPDCCSSPQPKALTLFLCLFPALKPFRTNVTWALEQPDVPIAQFRQLFWSRRCSEQAETR